ncbi:glycosyl hydrolase family 61-domain-containing protein [Xylariales sp. PMI_506]|nr:glycosyl hydrolase family 61-domain-containing protein [Xylariales sp. PMI_506]
MGSYSLRVVAAALGAAATVAAHGHVTNIVINGVSYQGYDPTVFPYETNPPTVVGWTAADTDNGFVAPDAYQNADIICHKSATPAGGHATVAAGSSISLQWSTWPDSHHGPMIDYLAPCNGACESVDKTTLKFFKIDGAGVVDPTAAEPGYWADDVLIANNFTWLVQIPSFIAPGNYVLRHEIIALHGGENVDGAQNYPQCFNLAITGTGTQVPSGVLGTDLYTETDPGILFNIYTSPLAYTVPGPTLVAGASSSVSQFSSAITASASATVGGGSGTATTSTGTTSTSVGTTMTTGTTATTLTTKTTTSSSTTSTATGTVPIYGQCGGIGYTGSTTCASGLTCTELNAYYYQCLS